MGLPSTLAGTDSTSSTTVTEGIVRVRGLLNETTAAFFDDNDITTWINEAIIDVIAKTWCNGITETITLAANTLEYNILSTYISVISVLYNDSKALLKGHPDLFGHVQDVGEPVFWYEFAGNLGVYPLSTVTNDVKLYLVEYPTPVTAPDYFPTPVIYDEAIVMYATAKGLFRDNEAGTAMQLKANYEEMLARYRVDFGHKQITRLSDVKEQA